MQAKVYFKPGNQVRKIQFAVQGSYEDFMNHLLQLYLSYAGSDRYEPPFATQLLYLDDENDWVSVNTQNEWEEAIRLYNGQVQLKDSLMRLKVVILKQKKTVAKKPVVHKHILCDGCGKTDIEGIRYKCNQCPDFDLCQKCYEQSRSLKEKFHNYASHEFTPIHRPSSSRGRGRGRINRRKNGAGTFVRRLWDD